MKIGYFEKEYREKKNNWNGEATQQLNRYLKLYSRAKVLFVKSKTVYKEKLKMSKTRQTKVEITF